ncbi:hypothetical protein C8T65DRAFT_656794 [Cerioporus squamosus]|nr:hypothetical protein C8T65DRAFT_656794 [Cerioporus squamosus]
MDLDGIARKIKEVSLQAMFNVCIPGDDPPEEILERAYYRKEVATAKPRIGTRSVKRKRAGIDWYKPPPRKGKFTDEICKISHSIAEAASKDQSSAPTIVTHAIRRRRYSARKTRLYPAGGVFINEELTSHAPVGTKEDPAVLHAVESETHEQQNEQFESWAELVVPIEVKVEDWDCAFTFDDERTHHLERTDHGTEALKRITKHVGQLFTRHHRIHIYALYVLRRQARILYFDRAYTLVSEPFKYGTRQHTALHTFFWRIARMSREQLGFDPTAVLANPVDVRSMLAYAPDAPSDYVEEQIYHALSVDPEYPSLATSGRWPAYELTMCGRRYVVGRPMFSKPSLQGRCTQGFLAYDIEGRTVRFIKDCWRPDIDHARPEHEIYERLNGAGVAYVLTCLGYEDVRGSDGSWQVTRTQTVVNRSRAAVGHYRLLIKEVCRPLTDFSHFREFTLIMWYALIAHREAWEKAGILHHDISPNNILIYEDGRGQVERRGMLCDWDLCKDKEQVELDQKRGTPDPAGTWLFRSALSLQFPNRPYELSDDIESFIHVYHYCVLRFHKKQGISPELFVERVYDDAYIRKSDGACIGGGSKLFHMTSKSPPLNVRYWNPTLHKLLISIHELCREHYSAVDVEALRDRYDPPSPPRVSPPVELRTPRPERQVHPDLQAHAELLKRFKKRERVQDVKPKLEEPPSEEKARASRLTLCDHEELLQLLGGQERTGR